jgi:hypothetical protein
VVWGGGVCACKRNLNEFFSEAELWNSKDKRADTCQKVCMELLGSGMAEHVYA